MNTFRLQMLRPDKQFYEGEVSALSVSEPTGKISVLPGHMPLFINITTDMASLTEADGTVKTFATGEGMLSVYKDRVVLQSDFLAWGRKAGSGNPPPGSRHGPGKRTPPPELPGIPPQ